MKFDDEWWYYNGPAVIAIGLIVTILTFLVYAIRASQQDTIACRQAGSDAVERPFPSVHRTCVPRAGHGVDTVYIKTAP